MKHYRLQIYFHDQSMVTQDDDNLNQLTLSMLSLIENGNPGMHGQIVSRSNGKVMHRCRKVLNMK